MCAIAQTRIDTFDIITLLTQNEITGMPRTYTNKILEAVESGLMDAECTLQTVLQYMSDSEVECMLQNMPDFEELKENEDEEEHDYDEIDIVNITWATNGTDFTPLELPECTSISLIDERMTSGNEYDDGEIHEFLADTYGCHAISFDVEVA